MCARRKCLVRLTRALVEAVVSLRHRLRLSARESDNCTIPALYQACLTRLKRPLPDRSDTSRVSDVCSERVPGAGLVRLTRVLVEAVFSLRHRLRLSACESDNCTITVWYQASLTMFKHPLPDRSGTSKVSDVCSDRVPGKAHQAASGSSYFVTVSAEAIGSCNRQLHYHRMVSGESHYAQTPAPRPLRHVQSLGCMLGESAWCWPGKAHQGTSWRRFFRYHVC